MVFGGVGRGHKQGKPLDTTGIFPCRFGCICDAHQCVVVSLSQRGCVKKSFHSTDSCLACQRKIPFSLHLSLSSLFWTEEQKEGMPGFEYLLGKNLHQP